MPKISYYRLSLVILFFIFIFASVCTYVSNQKEDIEKNILRLHIVANSDSENDQQLKLLVRDKILSDFSPLFKDAKTKQNAEDIISQNLDAVAKSAQSVITENGFPYNVSASLDYCDFPSKTYLINNGSEISLPKGRYKALNIKIGNAEGQNWWCVMYPSICICNESVGSSDQQQKRLKSLLSESEYKLITSKDIKIKYKFKLAELLSGR